MPRKDGKGSDDDATAKALMEELVLPFVECVTDEEGRRQLPPLLDEMNLVEIPISLLTKDNTSLTRVELTADGRRYLQSNNGYLLPSALAQQVLIGLLSLYRSQDYKYQNRIFQFPIRRLVEDYMYPGRYEAVRAPGKAIQSVLEQLRRIAHTRICHDDWWDHRLRQRVEIDASIIDYIKVVSSGGNRIPKTVEVAWGTELWRSLRAQYTKPLDRSIYASIDRSLDLRLWRWLDRQLAKKREQKLLSIQDFARSKLVMNNKTLDRGGRTASTYVAKQLEAAVKRLNGVGFPVRLTIDRNTKDFGITFERLSSGPNQVAEAPDKAGDLLRHFGSAVHGATRTSRRKRFAMADRTLAQAWIEQYGLDVSVWMTTKAARLYKTRTGEKPLTFRALEIYADAAYGAWEQKQAERAGQQRLPIEDGSAFIPRPPWGEYYSLLIAQLANPEQDEALSREVQSLLERQIGSFWDGMGRATKRKMLESAIKSHKIEKFGLLSEATYESLDRDALESELRKRHGISLSDLGSSPNLAES